MSTPPTPTRPMTHGLVLALALATVLLVVQARVILGGNTWDDVTYHTRVAPPRYAAAVSVQSARIPAWWDGTGLGVPLLAEPSHGAAYPFHWLAGTPRALELLLILHLWFAAVGVALWARRLGASDLGALVGGVLVTTTGVLASAALRGSLPALAWVPWIAWAAATRRHALLGVCIAMLGLAGELGVLVDAVVLALLIGWSSEAESDRANSDARVESDGAAPDRAARDRADSAHGRAGSDGAAPDRAARDRAAQDRNDIVSDDGPRRARVRLLLGLAAGLAIGALQWIPAALAIPHMAGAQTEGLPVTRLVELLVPVRGGAITQIGGAHAWFPSVFIGAPTLALAAVSRPTRRMIGLSAGLAVAAFVVGRGGWPAWFGAAETHLGVLAIVAAAHVGVAFDALVAADNEVLARRRRALFAIAGGALLTAITVGALGALRTRIEDDAARTLLDHALRDGLIATACALAAGIVAWRVRVGMQPMIVALLVVAPGVLAQPSLVPVIDRDVVDQPPAWVEKALASAQPVRVFRPVKLFGDVHDTSAPTLDAEIATFSGASGSLWGIDAARSEDPARPAAHDRAWLAAAAVGGQLLARYSIALAILPLAQIEGTNVTELGRRGSWALVRYTAPPPATVVYEWIFANGLDAELAKLFPPGSTRGLPQGVIVLHGQGAENQDEPSKPEPCTIERWTDGAIDLACTARVDGYAIVSSSPMPGWTATVDDHAAPSLTADVLRRAVAISTGTHAVRWRYRAPGLSLALVLAALGIVGLIALRLRR